eukprot:1301071-Rhodomonas_salina.2
MQTTTAGTTWHEDSRFDHAARWATFDGNDVGFLVELDHTRAKFVPKLKLDKWKEVRSQITISGSELPHDSVDSSEDAILTPSQQAKLWNRVTASLGSFREAAVKVAGATKEATDRQAMSLPGHRQMHRELNVIREIWKQVFLVGELQRAVDRLQLVELRVRLCTELQRLPMTVPQRVGEAEVTKASLLAETAELIQERTLCIDSETKAKRSENFKELAKKLQGSFNLGGMKTM